MVIWNNLNETFGQPNTRPLKSDSIWCWAEGMEDAGRVSSQKPAEEGTALLPALESLLQQHRGPGIPCQWLREVEREAALCGKMSKCERKETANRIFAMNGGRKGEGNIGSRK